MAHFTAWHTDMSFDPHADGVYRRHVSHFGEDFTGLGLGTLGSVSTGVTLCCCGCALLIMIATCVAGVLLLSQCAEENSSKASQLIRTVLWASHSAAISIVLVDHAPWAAAATATASHLLTRQLLRGFPNSHLTSTTGILCGTAVIANHLAWQDHFMRAGAAWLAVGPALCVLCWLGPISVAVCALSVGRLPEGTWKGMR